MNILSGHRIGRHNMQLRAMWEELPGSRFNQAGGQLRDRSRSREIVKERESKDLGARAFSG